MSRLVQAVGDLAAARDLDRVVEIVRHAARELVEADGATFLLRDEGQCFYVDEDAIPATVARTALSPGRVHQRLGNASSQQGRDPRYLPR